MAIPDCLNVGSQIQANMAAITQAAQMPQQSRTDNPTQYPSLFPPQFKEPNHDDFSLPGGNLISQKINVLVAGLGVLASSAIVAMIKNMCQLLGNGAELSRALFLLYWAKKTQ